MKNNTWRRLLAALIVCMMMVSGLNMLFANAEKPVTGEEPAATDNVEVPADEEPAEVPAEEEPADDEEPAGEEPAGEEPVAEEPLAEEPVAEEPVAEEPVAEEPVAEEPVAEEPVTEEPVAEEPVVEEPVAEEPVAEEPVAEEPVVEEPVAEEPVAQAAANAPAEEMEFEDYETPLGGEYQTVVLEDDEVDVREGADGMSNIFKTLPAGATITVVGIDGDWAHVVVDEQEGYIYVDDLAKYLELPEEEAEEGQAAAPVARKVTIFSSRRSQMAVGETVVLSCKLEGFEGREIVKYQWKCDKHDGAGFVEISGANSDTYSFSASVESLSWDWYLSVFSREIAD